MTPDLEDHIHAALWMLQTHGYNRRKATRIINELTDDRWEYIRQARAFAHPMPSKAVH